MNQQDKQAKVAGIIKAKDGSCTVLQCFNEEVRPGYRKIKRTFYTRNYGHAIELANKIEGTAN